MLQHARRLFSQRHYTEALAAAEQLLAQQPDDTAALELLADCHYHATRNAAAIRAAAARILSQQPENAYAHFLLGAADELDGNFAAAQQHFQAAADREDRAQFRLAALFMQQQRAHNREQQWTLLRGYDRFLRRFADDQNGLLNRAVLAAELGLYDIAVRDLQQAALGRDSRLAALADTNLALEKLRLGEFEQGWRLYERRWDAELSTSRRPAWSIRAWQGEDIGNAPLLVCTEQGYGDNIQFVRYAVAAKQCGFNVLTLNQTALHPLLAHSLQCWNIVSLPDSPLPEILGVPYYVFMMSLPHYLAPYIGSRPLQADAYLSVPPDYAQKWARKLPPKQRLRVGLVWAGSPKHGRNGKRSIRAEQFAALAAVEGVELHCLHKQLSADDAAFCRAHGITVWYQDLHDFADTAALLTQLDLLISVDTSVAHLAGALDVPVWILVSFNPDMRWLLERGDSVWYRSARLFRQPENLCWDETLQQAAQLLRWLVRAA